jgi:hypothetical protein
MTLDLRESGSGRQNQIPINWKSFEELCRIHCTTQEIADVLGISRRALDNRVYQKYDEEFSVVRARFQAQGKSSLRRAQFATAEKNPTMQIWLGKQLLGQKEKIDLSSDQLHETVGNLQKYVKDRYRNCKSSGTSNASQ